MYLPNAAVCLKYKIIENFTKCTPYADSTAACYVQCSLSVLLSFFSGLTRKVQPQPHQLLNRNEVSFSYVATVGPEETRYGE